MIRILVVDDHQLFREGMCQLLARHSEPVAVECAGNTEQALDLCGSHQDLDLILLDLGMPGLDGHDLIQTLSQRHCLVPVLVVSASEHPADVSRVMQAGAFGYVRKSASADDILAAIQHVLSGGIHTPPDYSPSSTMGPGGQGKPLTRRQTDVLQLLAEGHPNKRIAAILELSEDTVKSHLRALFESLKVKNRLECVSRARELGLLSG